MLSLCVLLAGMLLSGVPDAQSQGKGGKTPPPVLVTSTVHDVIGDTLQSDGLGPYVASSQILSQIYSQSGDWAVDLREQTQRNVYLTFVPTAPPVVSGPYPLSGLHNARVLSRCFDDGSSTGDGFLVIPPGQSNETCSLRIVFTSAGTSFVLVSSPLQAGTNLATVACIAPTDPSAACTRWTITPGSNPDPSVTTPRAALLRIGKGNRETFVGYYQLTYSIDLAR
jgi:hypothetical protein